MPQFYSQAFLFFRGGADGDEAPVRVIRGPDVKIPNTSNLSIDPVHREIFVFIHYEYPSREFIAVYPLDGSGNVAPLRTIEGPDTKLHGRRNGSIVVVDPVTDRIFVDVQGSSPNEPAGFLIFNRTDSGNVKPRGILHHPSASMSQPTIYPEKGLLFAIVRPPEQRRGFGGGGAASNADDNRNYDPQYHDNVYLGVWSVNDNGNVLPRWIIAAPPNGPLRDPIASPSIDGKHQDVYISDRYTNALYAFHVPEIFQ